MLFQCHANSTRTNDARHETVKRYANRPITFTLGGEVRKAARTLHNLMSGVESVVKDQSIVEDLLKGAHAILFITVVKMAFIGGVRMGTGLLVNRVDNGRGWSAPCSVGSFGITFGAEVGVDTTDLIIPVTSQKAVGHFMRGGGHMKLGGEIGGAFGPVGRTASAESSLSLSGASTEVGYSHSKGYVVFHCVCGFASPPSCVLFKGQGGGGVLCSFGNLVIKGGEEPLREFH